VNLSKKVRVRGASFAHIILLLFIRARTHCAAERPPRSYTERRPAGKIVCYLVLYARHFHFHNLVTLADKRARPFFISPCTNNGRWAEARAHLRKE
jgi:hypothetical protein